MARMKGSTPVKVAACKIGCSRVDPPIAPKVVFKIDDRVKRRIRKVGF